MSRLRARTFGFVSVIWVGVSVFAAVPLFGERPEVFGAAEWLCVSAMLPLPIFVSIAVAFLLTEKPRIVSEERPNPDFDIRKLY